MKHDVKAMYVVPILDLGRDADSMMIVSLLVRRKKGFSGHT